ncbi:putative reverse transcriptase domain-containing protein [Tanacetum coccineum]|uniref:Reverse transcriptase domain-containing protein n=1 Tax=Tanacetum coccineum TaxID=301880 RepID=A0ABQ5B8G7_9ASTR
MVIGDGSTILALETEELHALRMESVFHISNCAVENQVKFATCTFIGNALTWWNSHMKAITQDVAYVMDWKTLKKMMTVKYCPRGEIKKLEIELWNLKVKETDITSYTLRFQELSLMYGRMFPEESDKVEKYVGGLPDMIWGNVMGQQQYNGRNTGRAYTAGPSEDVGHLARDCRSSGPNGNKSGELWNQLCNVALAMSVVFRGISRETARDDGNIGINTILQGCTLNFLDHPFNINLMPIELGSFDVIVGMDWLAKHHAVIDCAEKLLYS